MIFQHTIDKVLSGEKTQTRRLRRLNETLYDGWAHVADGHKYISVWTEKDRCVYMVGKSYAVQPGRGQKAVARIRLTGIRAEDVREISEADVRAEGFTPTPEGRFEFLQTWAHMHDYEFRFWFDARIVDYVWYVGKRQLRQGNVSAGGWDSLQAFISQRPAERYQCWVLEFELVADNGA